jgi:hypothetical protein
MYIKGRIDRSAVAARHGRRTIWFFLIGALATSTPAVATAVTVNDNLGVLPANVSWQEAQAAGVADQSHMYARYHVDVSRAVTLAASYAEPASRNNQRVGGGCEGNWNLILDSSPANSDCICYDRRRRLSVVATSTDTWEWDGSAWEHVASGGTRGGTGAFVYDPVGQRCLYFGGYNNTQLWSWDGSLWTLLSNSPVPQRVYPAMAFDADRNRLVVHGGYDSGSTLYQDTWEWDPSTNTWSQTPTSPIGPLYAHRMVYDEARGQCVLHGGFYYTNQGDSWAWNGSTWTEITPQGPARYVFSMAYDRRGEQLLLNGGTQCCGEVEIPETWRLGLDNTWELCDDSAPARGYTNMTYDSHRHVLVFTGGIGPVDGGRDTIAETWERELGSIVPCDADIDGDLDVTFTDLLEVLGAWGQADPVADISGNGMVDTNDILAVISAWGPCP